MSRLRDDDAFSDMVQRLAKADGRIARGQCRIAQQRELIAKLERTGCPADHAKYLLAGMELLQSVWRKNRDKLLEELNRN